ncbi:uncharacterized protein DSM5745_10359 [Aspergillus mulundensis]|uniref:Uncharacterized protein n=1 Tax=Aspergillus mulundensis TaxID=1810919 RepID=A0A3D8QIW6_9EURO|nr:Uncharacterized protein DSM5745_10359 [Aspergillus mulundensis]RDW61687.1 Uncharacterized protein DSM5745_10359 [Aspergillus mulundensis]
MSIYERISSVSDRHSQILSELGTIGNAPDDLKSHRAFLSDLQRQLARTNRSLEEVGKYTQVERERHEKYRDSTIRRLMYRATGKGAVFEEKADQEMKDYYSALEKENKMKGEKEMLDAQVREATDEQKDLQAAATQCARLQDELDTMYKRLFEGPTSEFPEEDEQENATKAAEIHHREIKRQLNGTAKAAQCLSRAQIPMKEALAHIFQARHACETDMYGFGGALADYRQQNHLSNAQQKVSQTQLLVSQAIQLDSDVQPLPRMGIVQLDMVSSILFDNFLFNMGFLTMIQNSYNEVKYAEGSLLGQIRQAKSREDALRTQFQDAARRLERARKDLRKIREEAFIRAADPPPPYVENTPRTMPVGD